MKILLLGGTGAMGVHLGKMLADRGDSVVITSRAFRVSTEKITYLQGNARDLTFLSHILLSDKWDAVVDFMTYSTAEFAERVKLLLSSARQYVFLSSARVFANAEEKIVEESPRLLDTVEDEKYLSTDEYALAKARQENLLRENGENWTVIRPYITYNDYRLQLGVMEKEAWLYRALHNRSIVVSKELLSHKTTLTSGADVAKCMMSVIGNDNAFSQSFNITCGRSVKWSEVLDIYVSTLQKVLNRDVKVYLTDEDLSIKYGAKYQIVYDRFYDRIFDNSKICNIARVEFVDVACELEACLRRFLLQPRFGEIYWAVEGRKDCMTGEFTSLGEINGIKNKIKYLAARLLNL